MKRRAQWVAVVLGVALVIAGGIALYRLDTTGERGNGLGDAFNYSLDRWQRTDPRLIGYRPELKILTHFAEARGVAVGPDDAIYVVGDRVVQVFDPAGHPVRAIESEAEPRCLAVASDGDLFVGLKDHVEVLDETGKRLATWDSLGDNALITSVALASNDVFVADAGNRAVVRYSRAGELRGKIGGFIVPSPYLDVVVDSDGMLRAVNPGKHRIETYADDGTLTAAWGKASIGVQGFAGCCNPVHLAVLPNREFVTSEKGLSRVKIYSRDGAFVCVVAGPEMFEGPKGPGSGQDSMDGKLGWANDVAADSGGRVIVLDPKQAAVMVFVKNE